MEPQRGATSPNPSPVIAPGELSTGASTPDQRDLSDEAGEEQKGPHISKTTWGLMLVVAAILDILGILCVLLVVSAWVGWIIEIIGVLIFGLWFLIKRLPLISPKSLANWALNLLVGESFTAGAWPGFTFGILITMGFTKIKDVTGVDALQVVSMVEGRGAAKKALSTAAKTEASAVATAETAAVGATPAPTVGEHPVTASQKEHFADPSEPTAKGATQAPNPEKKKALPPPRRLTNPRDEEVATSTRRQDYGDDGAPFTFDPYQEDPYALESSPPRGIDALPRQFGRSEEQRAPFPGTGSPSFGRGSRQGGKLLDFKQKEAPQEAVVDETPTGATPRPEAA